MAPLFQKMINILKQTNMHSQTSFNFAESDISDFDNILSSSNRGGQRGQTLSSLGHSSGMLSSTQNNSGIAIDETLSSGKKYVVIDTTHDDPFDTGHTRQFYKGTSFRYGGLWKEGVHYIHDEYIVDFVVKDNILITCKKSHMSSDINEPKDWIEEQGIIVDINSEYWDVVISGPGESKPRHVLLSESEWEEITDPDPDTIYMIYEE